MKVPILVAVLSAALSAVLLVAGIGLWLYEEVDTVPGEPEFDYDGDGIPDPAQPIDVSSHPYRDLAIFFLIAGIIVAVLTVLVYLKSRSPSRQEK